MLRLHIPSLAPRCLTHDSPAGFSISFGRSKVKDAICHSVWPRLVALPISLREDCDGCAWMKVCAWGARMLSPGCISSWPPCGRMSCTVQAVTLSCKDGISVATPARSAYMYWYDLRKSLLAIRFLSPCKRYLACPIQDILQTEDALVRPLSYWRAGRRLWGFVEIQRHGEGKAILSWVEDRYHSPLVAHSMNWQAGNSLLDEFLIIFTGLHRTDLTTKVYLCKTHIHNTSLQVAICQNILLRWFLVLQAFIAVITF